MKGEKAVIFCQKLIHLRTRHASVCVCMTVKFMCVYVCGGRRGKGGQTKRESVQKDEKAQVTPMEGKKESELIGGWNWCTLNEAFFFCLHNMSPHLGHHVSSFSILFSPMLASLFCLLNLSFLSHHSFYSKTASPLPPEEHNPIHSYFRAYGIWKSLLHFSQPSRRTAVWDDPQGAKAFLYLLEHFNMNVPKIIPVFLWQLSNQYSRGCSHACQKSIFVP